MQTDLVQRVEVALEQIRDFLHSDGGNVSVVDITDGILKVKLEGSCEWCHVNTITLKTVIEKTVREQVPEITKVIQI